MQPYIPNRHQSGAGAGTFAGLVLGALPSSPGTALALDSNYIYGTSGDALGGTFVLDEDRTLTEFYFVASAKQGTGAINWEIRSGFGAANNKPGSLVSGATGTVNFSAITVDNWTKVSGLSINLSKHVYYTIVLGDADGSTSNFVTLRTNVRQATSSLFAGSHISTADGFATAGTSTNYPAVLAAKFSDGFVCAGAPIRATSSLTSNVVLRGIKITLPANGPAIVLSGVTHLSNTLGGMTVHVLKGAGSIPTDISSPFWSYTFPSSIDYSTTQQVPVLLFPEPLAKLVGGETYYIVIKPDANSVIPSKTTSYGGMDSDLRKLISGHFGISCVHVLEATGSTWTEDADATINGGFLCSIASQPTIAG
jgi:hypothetical protein